jgi:hypothetical protein
MSRVYETVKDRVQRSFDSDTETYLVGDLKPVTLRFPSRLIHAVDALATVAGYGSRQSLLNELINEALGDAIQGYCDAHGTHASNARWEFDEILKKFDDGDLKPVSEEISE